MGRLKFVCSSLLLVYFLVIHVSAVLRFSVSYQIVFFCVPEETDFTVTIRRRVVKSLVWMNANLFAQTTIHILSLLIADPEKFGKRSFPVTSL